MRIILLVSTIAFSLALWAQRHTFDRYQSIVDRQMFGEPPPGFDPTRPPSEVSRSSGKDAAEQLTQEQREIKSAIHFSVINVTPLGDTAVGFTDNGDSKNPVHYYLKVGETRNGWTVKEADPVKATMTISKGEVEVTLSIGDNSAKGGAAKAVPAVAAAGAAAGKPAVMPVRASLLSGSSLRGRRMLRERQRQEVAAQAAQKAEEAKLAAEERERQAAEEKAQREQEREELRSQLQQLQEGLRKEREERAAERAKSEKQDNQGDQ